MEKVWGILTAIGTICFALAAIGLSSYQCSTLCNLPLTESVVTAGIVLGIISGIVAIVAAILLFIRLFCCEVRIASAVIYFVACAFAVASGIIYPIYIFESNLVEATMAIQLILHVQCALAGFYCIFA